LAFHSAKDAIAFAIRLQESLRDADWNEDILAQPDACDFMGMRGLRVRMGIHFGPVTKRNNAVTGRLEYTGETLKIAQKIEGMADGGDILTTRSTFEASGSNAKVKDMEDGIVKVLVARNTSRFRSSSLGNGSVHSLTAMDSAAKRLSEGRKKRQTSMKKSISRDNGSFNNQSLRPKRTSKNRGIRASKSMTDAEAALKLEGMSSSISSQQNFQWGVKT
jgi:Adenylate and Guanylate cyclase catalytic domain